MAKKALSKTDRSDPRKNKSLAVRNVLKRMPNSSTSEVMETVKKEYGQSVSQNMIYMIKTKTNMDTDGRPRKAKGAHRDMPMNSTTTWIEAISAARQLLKVAGNIENATALLKALDK